jgi:hypothetical protein
VELTEIDIVNHFDHKRVHGLFPGFDANQKHWSHNFTFWKDLRAESRYPAAKITGKSFGKILNDHTVKEHVFK